MFPAARIADPITHDMLVPSGIIGPQAPAPCPFCPSQPVIIEGMPAAHVLCTSVCSGAISAGIVHPPLPLPPAPPPPILKGSLTVFIHGMPALRWSPAPDITTCGAFLGDPKLAAMRRVFIGDVGMGGGAAGAPPVPISFNPDGSIQFGSQIRIEGDPEFRARTLMDLVTLSNTTSGREIIDSINSSGRTVTIVETDRGNACGYANGADRFTNADGTPGPGTDSTVHYNPNRTQIGDGSEPWMSRPPAVGLGHELVHADRAAHGTQPPGSTDGTRNRERQAVGLPPYDGESNNENGIRDDLGEPRRTRY